MENKHLRAIELPKVLDMLAAHCSCPETREMALNLEPSSDIDEVRVRLNESWDAHRLLGRFGGPSFGGVRTVANAIRRAQAGGVLSIAELLHIAEVLRIVRGVRDWRSRCEGVVTSFDSLFMALMPNKRLEDAIGMAILNEEELHDTASSELASIRRKIRSAQNRVREQLDKLVHSSAHAKHLQDAIITQRNGRFVVPVKAECRGEVAGLVHDTSSSGATVFIEPMAVVEANNEIRVLMSKEQAEVERILTDLSVQAGDVGDGIVSSYNTLLELDLIFAKGKLGYDMRASLPSLNDEGIIVFNKARHPLIPHEKVVAADIRLGGEFDTLVITGPNTGGKTVTIKTLGLLSAMAMCGLLLPVSDGSTVSVFDNILADIGDEQSIEQSLSTFSAHMTNIIRILGTADEKALVLIDELGAGTDPVEGAALATAILDKLRHMGAKIAATTHYAELKSYAINTPGVENGCCEFDVATLRPTYRLLIGMPGRSNAFAISERLGMPADVVEHARELVSTESSRFEEVVEKLEARRQSLEAEQQQAAILRAEAQRTKDEALAQSERLDKERAKILEQARQEAARIVSMARGQSDALLAEIEQLRRDMKNAEISSLSSRAKSELRARMREMENAADPIAERSNEDYTLPRELKIGDEVLLVDMDLKATVIRLPDSSGNLEVKAGILSTRTSIDNVRLLSEKKKKAPAQTKQRTVSKSVSSDAVSEIDVRGMNVDEATIEVDRAIDAALMKSMNELRVIHGKGTGALRAGLHAAWRKHPHVRTFRVGTFGEGENGVSIIELK